MLGLSGQLGIGGLGNFVLATVRVGLFIPHRGRASSDLAPLGAQSGLTSARASSTLSGQGARSSLSSSSPQSTVSSDGAQSEVTDG